MSSWKLLWSLHGCPHHLSLQDPVLFAAVVRSEAITSDYVQTVSCWGLTCWPSGTRQSPMRESPSDKCSVGRPAFKAGTYPTTPTAWQLWPTIINGCRGRWWTSLRAESERLPLIRSWVV